MWYIHSVICIAIAVVGKDAVTGVFFTVHAFILDNLFLFSTSEALIFYSFYSILFHFYSIL